MSVFLYGFFFLIPLIMIAIGYAWKNNHPDQINQGYGYRSTASMKNEATWGYAQRISGKYYRIGGWSLFIVSLLFAIPYFRMDESYQESSLVITLIIHVFVLLFSIILVEYSLKKKFNKSEQSK